MLAEPLVPLIGGSKLSRLKFRILPFLGALSVFAALLGDVKSW